jgi:glycosyltransferase involved in cell wall biosynthesis
MAYLAWIIFIFTILQLLVALVNLLYKPSAPEFQEEVLVSVLIPARNEEGNIMPLITSLQKQDYQNIEILIFDDQSTDNTAQLVKNAAREDNRIKYFSSGSLPEGWFGKNYACHMLSEKAKGRFLLFLDADVIIGDYAIRDSIASSVNYKLGLLTYFPAQVMVTLAEKITVPNMNYILLSLLPLVLVQKSGNPALAAANGQFMFYNAEVYRKYQPHMALRTSSVEDIESARYLKRNGEKVSCRAAGTNISCRMYSSYSDAVHGFSRNIIMYFGNSYLLAIVFWLVTSVGFVAVYIAFPVSWFIFYLTVVVLTRVFVSAASRQPLLQNLILAVPQQISMGIFIYTAFANRFKKHHLWKGRNISYA